MARLTCPQCGNTIYFRTVGLMITTSGFTIEDDGEILWDGDTNIFYETGATYAIECVECATEIPQEEVIASKLCDIQLDKGAYEYTCGEGTWIEPDC